MAFDCATRQCHLPKVNGVYAFNRGRANKSLDVEGAGSDFLRTLRVKEID